MVLPVIVLFFIFLSLLLFKPTQNQKHSRKGAETQRKDFNGRKMEVEKF